jgi:hypothetical protein
MMFPTSTPSAAEGVTFPSEKIVKTCKQVGSAGDASDLHSGGA